MRYIVAVEGTVKTDQFLPRGTSDADTVKLDISQGAIYYGKFDSEELTETRIFEGAYALVENKKEPLISKKRIVDVRLQGIDAAELHLPVKIEGANTVHFRQYFGKTATVKLLKLLGGPGRVLPCQIWSYVDSPGDLFDAYGRLIGDAFIDIDEKTTVHINSWLVEKGLVVPTFYASMLFEEIDYLLSLSSRAHSRRLGLWPYLTDRVKRSELKLTFRYSDRTYDPRADLGPVLFPKVFRRAANWMRALQTGSIDRATTFRDYLISEPPVVFAFLSDFLNYGPYAAIPRYYLEDAVTPGGIVKISPLDVIFFEQLSRIFDQNDIEIKSFEDDLIGLLHTVGRQVQRTRNPRTNISMTKLAKTKKLGELKNKNEIYRSIRGK
ncbi:MAG: thermonuclease family protein [Candidatus Obscuribacterales bacterium]|nr:thermonuclease family protein [Candidatus Obscuribacterales bacterium]